MSSPMTKIFLCFLAGELTNSAHYFTTFANEEQCRVAALVAKKKKEVEGKSISKRKEAYFDYHLHSVSNNFYCP